MAANQTHLHCVLDGFPDSATPGGMRVYAINGVETLSECFEYQVEAVVPNNLTQPVLADVIDKPVLLTFDAIYKDAPEKTRLVHGMVDSMEVLHEDIRHTHYTIHIVPQLWRLTQRSDCRIFQLKTPVDIITEVLTEAGLAGDDFKFVLQESHAEREYCCQYRENDLDFIQRLMAEEGMYFYFEHTDGQDIVVFADTPTIDAKLPGGEAIKYLLPGGGVPNEEHIRAFNYKENVRSGSFTHTHYKFKNPALNLEKNEQADKNTELAQFDYYGRYEDPGAGQTLAKFRLEHMRTDQKIATGSTDSIRFQLGSQFELTHYDQQPYNGKYKVISAWINATQSQVDEGIAGGDGGDYTCDFTCIPDDVPLRSLFIAPKPQVYGPQTADVVGPAGEEIYVDEHGRVKVQFRWDRYGASDEHSSVWLRVSQGWGGAAWGAMFIPRIGHEVIVDFLEGDIDQPIITGRVYHGTNVPPYPLPANKTVSTIKSQTHKGEGFNELRFEDEAGQEEVYFHAQKDHNLDILNDRSKDVGRDQSEHVHRDKRIQIDGGHTETINKSMTITVNQNLTETVALNYAETVGVAHQLSVGAAMTVTVGAAYTETVGGIKAETIGLNKTETIGKNKSVNVQKDLSEKIRMNQNTEIGKDYKRKVKDNETMETGKNYRHVAKKIQLEAADELHIKVGKAEILMKKNGNISIKAGGKLMSTGKKGIKEKGKKITEN